MAGAAELDLSRPRGLGEILAACFELYGRHFPTFAAIALAIVVPMDLISLGLIEGHLSSGYDEDAVFGGGAAYTIVTLLVTTPLITAGHVHAVMDVGEGRKPKAARSLQAAGAVLLPVLGTVLAYSLGVMLGTLLLVVPGIFLAIYWYVAAQIVVAEGRGPAEALSRSGDLVGGSWWRVFGVVIVLSLVAMVPALALGIPVTVAAGEADSGLLLVLGTILLDTVLYSFLALTGTILFFDLRARRGGSGASAQEDFSLPPSDLPPR